MAIHSLLGLGIGPVWFCVEFLSEHIFAIGCVFCRCMTHAHFYTLAAPSSFPPFLACGRACFVPAWPMLLFLRSSMHFVRLLDLYLFRPLGQCFVCFLLVFSNTAVTSTAAQTQPSSQIQASRDRSSTPPTQQPQPSPVHSSWPANSPPWVLGLRFRVGGLVLNAWSLGEVMGFEGVGLAYWLLFNMVLLLGCSSRFQHASAGRFTISCRPSGDVVM